MKNKFAIKPPVKRQLKNLALLFTSVALAANLSTVVPQEKPVLVDPPATIEYQLDSEAVETPIVEEPAVPQAKEPLGFWGLQRRFWDKLAPVRQGIINNFWRVLSWALSLVLALAFVFIWPLPQILSKSKEKFADWLADHGFSHFSLVLKLVALAGLVGVYFLIPSQRRPWILVIGAACVSLIVLAYCYLFRLSKKTSGRELVIREG
ncbi:MAG: hypothetical protein Q4E09_04560 [Eubacteriales bacterium]|nr:hypothetical protein [Eubacteriales bacterium]